MQPLYFLITTVGNIKTYKKKSTDKIGGAVVTIMVFDRVLSVVAMITALRSMIAVGCCSFNLAKLVNYRKILHYSAFA
jgi:hypothetical protein